MIILDTNVLSELMKSAPDNNIVNWLNHQPANTLYTTATSLAELLTGLTTMPAGKRRENLFERQRQIIETLIGTRVLPFDADAARTYAMLNARARRAGVTISFGDGQIAAIADVRKFAVATRDTSPFIAAGLQVINPWSAATVK